MRRPTVKLKWNAGKIGLQKVLAFLLAVCVCISSVGMNVNAEGGQTDAKKLKGVKISQESAEVKVGETIKMSAEAVTAAATDTSVATATDLDMPDEVVVEWASSNEKAAAVSAKTGNEITVTAMGEGTADITATIKSKQGTAKTATCKVTVKPAEQPEQPAVTVKLNKTSMTLEEGQSEALTVTEPKNAKVTWASSNEKIAKVDQSGKVTAVAEGTAKITATPEKGTAGECAVTVRKKASVPVPAVPTIKIVGNNKYSLDIGKSQGLKVEVTPANTKVTWKSSNDKIATVDQKGNVKAVAAGTATITATPEGGKGVTFTITVNKPAEKPSVVKVKSLSIGKNFSLNKGKTRKLTVTFNPKNTSNKAVEWKSSNKKVATVDQKGNVKAVGKGTATITATSKENKKVKATCKVTVKIPSTKITTNVGKKTVYVQKGKKTTVQVILNPKDTTDTIKAKASNGNVKVTVKKNVVTIQGKKTGKSTITLTTSSKKTVKVTVQVVKNRVKATKVKLNKTSAELIQGKTLSLKATVNPTKTTDTITCKSSNSKVASVDQFGKVTAKKAGKATITVTVGGKKATCKITVSKVILAKKSATIKVKKSFQIKVKESFKKGDAIKSCKSSNKNVATVTNKGKITGKKAGKATITVTMKSGAKVKFTVTVKR